jgi:formate dehydrogenase subunit gamma
MERRHLQPQRPAERIPEDAALTPVSGPGIKTEQIMLIKRRHLPLMHLRHIHIRRIHKRLQDAIRSRAQSLIKLLFLCAVLVPAIAVPEVPHKSAYPAYAEEQTILQQEKDSIRDPKRGAQGQGFSSPASGQNHFDRHYIIPPGFMDEQDLILQRGGNTWRHLRNGPFATVSGIVLVLVFLTIVVFYRMVGPAQEVQGTSGRQIRRFTSWDRLVHWAAAISFLLLAATGLIVLFGKKILLPWMGHDVFSWLAAISKFLHNFTGPVFIACSIAMFLTYLRRNVFRRVDWEWIRQGGGIASHRHVPAGYFNAGEKMWFWGGVTLLGILISLSGLMLNFPYIKHIGSNIAITRYLLQLANYLHIACATAYIAAAMGHIYIGTWGTPGAYKAMRDGNVDEEWARAHHELWYQEVMNNPAAGGTPPRGAKPGPGI